MSLEAARRARCWSFRCERRRVPGSYAEEFLQSSDLERKRIELKLPEGLLELQAPLSAEEKLRQKLEADEARAAGESKKRR